jgi:hypothetical protein
MPEGVLKSNSLRFPKWLPRNGKATIKIRQASPRFAIRMRPAEFFLRWRHSTGGVPETASSGSGIACIVSKARRF